MHIHINNYTRTYESFHWEMTKEEEQWPTHMSSQAMVVSCMHA